MAEIDSTIDSVPGSMLKASKVWFNASFTIVLVLLSLKKLSSAVPFLVISLLIS
jgi:hypothetical protein